MFSYRSRNPEEYPYKNESRKNDSYIRPDSSGYHKEEFESSGYGSSATQVSYEQKRYNDSRDSYYHNGNQQRGYRFVYLFDLNLSY